MPTKSTKKQQKPTLQTITDTLEEHSKELAKINKTLNEHTESLQDHEDYLLEHSRILAEHSDKLAYHSNKLDSHEDKFNLLIERMDSLERLVEERTACLPRLLDAVDVFRTEIKASREERIFIGAQLGRYETRLTNLEKTLDSPTKFI